MPSDEFKEFLRELNFWRKDARKWRKEVKKSRSLIGVFTFDNVCECGVEDNAVCKVCGQCYFCHEGGLSEIYDHADLYHELEGVSDGE